MTIVFQPAVTIGHKKINVGLFKKIYHKKTHFKYPTKFILNKNAQEHRVHRLSLLLRKRNEAVFADLNQVHFICMFQINQRFRLTVTDLFKKQIKKRNFIQLIT